ncbi:S8 family serine peptidase [Streptomyces sp. NPDC059979]|uniref:S8 family peptidase n=1 Tax=Streptomyces sp. NPDC059979 TaxID=3347021 RepID=UPI0036CEEABE
MSVVAAGKVGEVPVLVTYTEKAAVNRAAEVAGATAGRPLPSIDGRAMEIADSGRWWQEVRGKADAAPAARSAGSLAGVKKVWLNGLSKISLEKSVPQIGANIAWDRGFDGAGVTVAVLDTGIDAAHPDVSGSLVEQVDFTGNPRGPRDGHGHGTHVASTILGTGAASKGLRKGVAPAAKLRVGKVCDDVGGCSYDAIIAGMEWAAGAGAEVVNLSLGGPPSDGTDPLSQSLNQLSRSTGTLFVVAAGNSGPLAGTVGTPGAADEALTVAAVDAQDNMADFSSRGPRVGDGAAKPDIAAPGVDIVAARAAGTAMGSAVDAHYTAASGTSMATPHVAGAAAIMAQRNADLSGPEIKALLMSSAANLGHDVHAQGTGRVDLIRAIDPRITVSGNAVFGQFAFPHTPRAKKITYSNHTDEATTLHLSGSFVSAGQPAPAGLFTLSSDKVVVPAKGSAEVTLTLDGSVLGTDGTFGVYSGLLSARDSEGVLRATSGVGAYLEPEKFPLTVNVVRPPGATEITYGYANVLPVDEEGTRHGSLMGAIGSDTFTLPAYRGIYSIQTPVRWRDAAGAWHDAIPVMPEVSLTKATTVTMDLRQLKPVSVRFPEATEIYGMRASIQRKSYDPRLTVHSELAIAYGADQPNWWVLPASGQVRAGSLTQHLYTVQTTPLVTMRATGGGAPLSLTARYQTPDASLLGEQVWRNEDLQVGSRNTAIPLPRLPITGSVPVVYGGAGSAADLAGTQVRGKLVLLTPTDICTSTCDFPRLRDERVAAAAAAGATGVLVAAPGLTSVGIPSQLDACLAGPESCPAGTPYAALPIVHLPYAEADRLISRIKTAGSHVKISLGGSVTPKVYAARFFSVGHIPTNHVHELEKDDLNRVDHHFHADRPGHVSQLQWSQQAEGTPPAEAVVLPRPTTQQTMTVFVNRQDNAIDRFSTSWGDLGKDLVQEQVHGEAQELILTRNNEVHWNEGPAVPGAVPLVRTKSGFSFPSNAICSGCRQGDTFYPSLHLTSSGGAPQALTGFVDNERLTDFVFRLPGCGPKAPVLTPTLGSTCDFRLLNQSGSEIDRRITHLQYSLVGNQR